MNSKTTICCGRGYVSPSCKVLLVNCGSVICVSGGLGAPEIFGGFSDADGDYFE